MAKSKKKSNGLKALYASFLARLSSSERESIKLNGLAKALPAFRKYLNTLSEPEMAEIVGVEEEEAEE